MSKCERVDEIIRGGDGLDESHVRSCRDCGQARLVHLYLQKLAAADDLAPSLPDPRLLVIKADLMRARGDQQAEDAGVRWAGVGIWSAIAMTWLIVLTWKLGEIQSLLERFDLVPALPGGPVATAILVAAAGGLVAFTIFAVAVHSVLAEL